ncbi:hypothetical protein DFO66_10122 [Brevibacterium sanguinis]|uniref:Amidohydrolase 3 domain-containing protein n=2 Tax=Brevibacterium TaxID=1696 RepID=A0A366IR07_9MICO|nr:MULTISPECIES: amidohydrolase [Brevibacterium]RBP67802.1 hypothetical protein DFO66_10122 [Brevibacterium sanguinis]RBP74781.1 hypothetical protein DFO65_101507 [Brevibacterium celere]
MSLLALFRQCAIESSVGQSGFVGGLAEIVIADSPDGSYLGSMSDSELLVTGARIRPIDVENSVHSAMLVRSGRVVALGTEDEMAALGPHAEVVDVGGRTVLPGFIDAHNHMSFAAFAPASVNCMTPPLGTLDEVLQVISTHCEGAMRGQWITGFGFDGSKIRERRNPTRKELDAAAPHHPFFLVDVSGHAGYANSLAFEEMRISECTPNPWGGSIEMDGQGQPSGTVTGTVAGLLNSVSWEDFAQRDWDRATRLLEQKAKDYLAVGLTGISDAGVTPTGAELYRRADREGRLPLTVQQIHAGDFLFDRPDLRHTELLDRINAGAAGSLRNGAVKIWVDRAYPDGAAIHHVHDGCVKHVGTNFYSERDLRTVISQAAELGINPVVHAMGDCAIDMVLDAYAEVRRSVGSNIVLRLEHAFVAGAEQADRMSELGVDLVANPGLAHNVGDQFVGWRGNDQPHLKVLPVRTMIDRGVRVSFASDHPAGDFSPARIMATAIDRGHLSGAQIDPEEAVTVEEAVRAYTCNAALASDRADEEGTLEVGKRANFIVVDRDPFTCSADMLRDLVVDRTYVDGQLVHHSS